jgi:EAL domain-containing protein (putative c-di-GMP-specific phosphodiesterase class I)
MRDSSVLATESLEASSAPQRRRLRQDIRHAAANGAFSLWLQPRYSLADGSLRGAEAQIRWPHRGSIGTPSAFMPLVEACGLTDMVAAWTLTAACAAAQSWPNGPGPPPYVALTVPNWSLDELRLPGHVAAALAETELCPERLDIAVSETGLAEAGEDKLLMLCALRDLGIGLTLDECGGPSANLLTLARFPLTAVKLDRSLVRDLPADRTAASVTSAIITLGHALGVAIIAAGVETPAQRDFLLQAGCDQAQGALFGRLVVEQSFPALLQAA